MMRLFTTVRGGGNRHEDKRENAEHKRLHKADEEFESVKDKRHAKEVERTAQECHNQQDHFTGENIAKQPEGERDNLDDLAHKFQNADKEIDETVEQQTEIRFPLEQRAEEFADLGKVEKFGPVF